jgi:hypothetical protein
MASISVFLPQRLGSITGETAMQIKKHDAIWWNLELPTTEIDVADIDDDRSE